MKNIFMEVGAAWLEKRKNLPGDPLGENFPIQLCTLHYL